ncbi:MAG: hypothetical protein RBG1_1C00001G0281 [candidate division Zixibacteria bacterium RBG-1]|nr:MAG: hypothetical protein RBG1_1C00001G0281 [candidate division Zixibacteria bacterium RBG-1]
MTTRRIISWLNLLMGFVLLLVGVLHFVMMGHIENFISGQLDLRQNIDNYVIAIFKVNHVGSGVFVLLLGMMLIYLSGSGLRRGKRWGRNLTTLVGLGMSILSLILWLSVPKILLEAEAFKIALISLSAVGVITLLPLLLFWKHFNER